MSDDAEILALGLDSSAARTGADEFERATDRVTTSATNAAKAVDTVDVATNQARQSVKQYTAAQLELIKQTDALVMAGREVDVQNRAAVNAWMRQRDALRDLAGTMQQLDLVEAKLVDSTQMLLQEQMQARDYATRLAQARRELASDTRRAAEAEESAARRAAAAEEGAAAASGVHGLQLGRINMELGTAIGRFTGMNTAATRFGAMLGGAVAGYGQMIAISVVLVAIAKGYELITQHAQEAAKAADEFAKSEAGRAAASTGLGIANQSLQAGGGSNLRDIPALSEEAKKASDAVRGLENEIASLANAGGTGTAGGAIAGGPTREIRELSKEILTGRMNTEDFEVAMRSLPQQTVWQKDAQDLMKWGSELYAAKQHLDAVNAALLQTSSVNRYYTQTLGGVSVSEGELIEKISERTRVLAAYRSGGVVAGKHAEDEVSALDGARKLYEDYAKSGKDATLATLTFQDALKRHNPIAEAFYNEQKKLFDINTAIANTQRQATAATTDTNHLQAITDQVARFAAEAQEFGKDASIDGRIRAMDDSLDHFVTSMRDQVAVGKMSKASFEQQSAAVEQLRQSLYAAGADIKSATDDQVTKQITDQYTAQLALNKSFADGAGNIQELTAAKAAQNQIDALAKQLGHELTDEQKALVLSTHELAAALHEGQTTQTMLEQAAAIRLETEAMSTGMAAREAYTINKRADLEITKALRLATMEEMLARINAIEMVRRAELAHMSVATAQKLEHTATVNLEKENQKLAQSFEKDLSRAIEQFADRGIKSFQAFLQEVQRLSLRLAQELDQSIEKAYTANDSEAINHFERLQKIAQLAGAGVTGAIAGYNIGAQSTNQTAGFFGGAAAGAVTGGAVGGPWGAVIGGMMGAVGGLFGAAEAQKHAAEALQKASNDAQIRENAFVAQGQGGGVGSTLSQLDATMYSIDMTLRDLSGKGIDTSARQAAVDQSYFQQRGRVFADTIGALGEQLNAANGPAGEYANQVNAIEKQYRDNLEAAKALNMEEQLTGEIEEIRTKQLAALKAAQDAQTRVDMQSLELRGLQAAGDSAAVRTLQELMEVEQAERDRKSDLYIASLKLIQAYEDEVAAKKKLLDMSNAAAMLNLDMQARYAKLAGDTNRAAVLDLEKQQTSEFLSLTGSGNITADKALELIQLQTAEMSAFIGEQRTNDLKSVLQKLTDKATSALQAQLKVEQDQLSVLRDSQRTAQEEFDSSAKAVDGLTTFRASLNAGDISTLSPGEQKTAAWDQVQSLFRQAQLGDKTAATNFGGAATDFLTQDHAFNGSNLAYANDSDAVKQMADQLIMQYGVQKSIDQQMLDSTTQQVDLLSQQINATQRQIDVIRDVSSQLSTSINHASQQQIDALTTAMNGTAAQQVAAIAQLAQALGVSTSVPGAGGLPGAAAPPTDFAKTNVGGSPDYILGIIEGNIDNRRLEIQGEQPNFDYYNSPQLLDDLYDYVVSSRLDKEHRALLYANYGLSSPESQFQKLFGTMPGYASGGTHPGGIRAVGEKGMEFELTGQSRIVSNSGAQDMLVNAMGASRELRDESRSQTKELRAMVRQLGTGLPLIQQAVADVGRRMARVEDELRLRA